MGQGGCCAKTTKATSSSEVKGKRPTAAPAEFRPPEVPLQGLSEYRARYKEKGPVVKGGKALEVVTNDEKQRRYVCRKLTRQSCPCKDVSRLEKHFSKLACVQHPHVAKFVEVFQDKDSFYLIYERAEPTALFDHIRSSQDFAEEDAADFARQVIMALSVSHEAGIFHGRLSPSSLILSAPDEDGDDDENLQLKICDLGQGFVLRPSLLQTTERSAKNLEKQSYAISPELAWGEMQGSGESGQVPKGTDKHDVWALGTIVFHMLTGSAPFHGVANKAAVAEEVKTNGVTFREDEWMHVSDDARDAVSKMLLVNPPLRISFARLLKHPWIKIARTTMPKKRMLKLLQNMRLNLNENHFKRLVIRVIAEQLPRDDRQFETIECAFRCLDQNGDGVLQSDEIVKGLQKYPEFNAEEVASLFGELDRSGDGTISIQEFVTATMNQSRTTSFEALWHAFNTFDRNRDGSVTLSEVDKLVKNIEGTETSKEQVQELREAISQELEYVSSGGSIDFDQFVEIMHAPADGRPDSRLRMTTCLNRLSWRCCGSDVYKVRRIEPKCWDFTRGSPRSPRSVYRNRRRIEEEFDRQTSTQTSTRKNARKTDRQTSKDE